MRGILITDSLGLSRKEVAVEDTWTNNVIYKLSREGEGNILWTVSRGGLSFRDLIKDGWVNCFKTIKPEFIIIQLGIVDCCRRPYPQNIKDFMSRNLINKLENISKKYYYTITKMSKFYVSNKYEFQDYVGYICKEAKDIDCKIAFICIAGSTESLEKKIFNVKNDIKDFNRLLKRTISTYKGATFLNPYKGYSFDDYILEDGYHLNELGHSLVTESVLRWYQQYVNK